MSGGESTWPDERIPEWLAAFDDSLATGSEPPPQPDAASDSKEVEARLQKDAAWCRFVRQAWPRESVFGPPFPSHSTFRTGGRFSGPAGLNRLRRYRIRRELGRGAFGIVFLGYDPELRREVALKVPRPEVVFTPELRARFRQEAQAAASLEHPNIVPVYDAGEEGGVCFIASAYCPGITLAAWLKRLAQPIAPRVAAHLVALLADAVDHAHSRGVLHRDLKPANVLLESEVRGPAADIESEIEGMRLVPKITDFGLAKFWRNAIESGCETYSGAILGTPNYMAPEQTGGSNSRIEPATDVYALGAILYELFTGRPPFRSDSPLETLWRTRSEEVVPPRTLRPDLPPELETICLKCLEKDPARRYPSASSLSEDLRRYLSRQAIQARPPSAGARLKRWAARRPRTLTAAVFTLVVLLTPAACLLAFHGLGSSQAAAPPPPEFAWDFNEGTLPPGTSTFLTEIIDSLEMKHKDGTILRLIHGGKSWIGIRFPLEGDSRVWDLRTGRWNITLIHLSTDVDDQELGYSPVRVTVNGHAVWEGSPPGPLSAPGHLQWVTTRVDITDKLHPGTNQLRWETLRGLRTHYWLKSFRVRWEPGGGAGG